MFETSKDLRDFWCKLFGVYVDNQLALDITLRERFNSNYFGNIADHATAAVVSLQRTKQ